MLCNKTAVCVGVQMSSTSEHAESKTLKLKQLCTVISNLKYHLKTIEIQTKKLHSKNT